MSDMKEAVKVYVCSRYENRRKKIVFLRQDVGFSFEYKVEKQTENKDRKKM